MINNKYEKNNSLLTKRSYNEVFKNDTTIKKSNNPLTKYNHCKVSKTNVSPKSFRQLINTSTDDLVIQIDRELNSIIEKFKIGNIIYTKKTSSLNSKYL